jgi:hypothetical protein
VPRVFGREKWDPGKLSKIQDWIKVRKLTSPSEQPFLRVSPTDNVILGAARIKSYLGVRSHATLYRWIELYGLPVVKRPDGLYITTMTAIDTWLFLAAECDLDNREWSRGTNARLAVAKRRIEKKIARGREKRTCDSNGDRTQNGSMDSRPAKSEVGEV